MDRRTLIRRLLVVSAIPVAGFAHHRTAHDPPGHRKHEPSPEPTEDTTTEEPVMASWITAYEQRDGSVRIEWTA